MSEAKLYNEDFAVFRECKEILIREIDLYQETTENRKRVMNGYYTKRGDGSRIRVVMPQGGEILQSIKEQSKRTGDALYFVGFVGFARKDIDSTFVESVWEHDQKLIEEMQRHEDIISYVTTERGPGGDWSNLVLYRHPRAVDKWGKADVHTKAVVSFSPRLYLHVRIHRGTLENGLFSELFGVERTLFVKYEQNQFSIKQRYVKQWREDEYIETDNCYTL